MAGGGAHGTQGVNIVGISLWGGVCMCVHVRRRLNSSESHVRLVSRNARAASVHVCELPAGPAAASSGLCQATACQGMTGFMRTPRKPSLNLAFEHLTQTQSQNSGTLPSSGQLMFFSCWEEQVPGGLVGVWAPLPPLPNQAGRMLSSIFVARSNV